jgi:hypothetical protein
MTNIEIQKIAETYDSWELDEPYHARTLEEIRDQLLDESGFRRSIVDRGLKRLDDVVADGDDRWLLAGRPDLADNFPLYTVRLDNGLYSCSCYGHQWGGSRQRRICSHVIAVIVARRLNRVQVKPSSQKLQLTPADLGLPAKFKEFRQQQLTAIERIRGTDKRFVLLQGPTGCHRAGQSILMFDGTVKPVEEIQAGDLLMGPDSQPRKVLHLVRGFGPMVEIRPVKGESWVVNEDHVLTLVRTNSHPHHMRSDCKDGNIVDVTVRDWLGWSKTQKHLHKLFRVPVEFTKSPLLPLDPYVLGLLIGDGSLKYQIGFTKPDAPVRVAVVRNATASGLRIRKQRGTLYVARRGRREDNHILKAVRSLGLDVQSPRKFIPHIYKTASREHRLALLAGLLDTDAYLGSSCFEFSSASHQLADDIAFLARSLGLAAYVRQLHGNRRFNEQSYSGERYWRVSISGDGASIPTRIPRKQALPRRQKKNVLRTGFKVVPTGTVEPFFGFILDGDGRYLLGDFTVTHNSGKTLTAAAVQRIFKERFLYSCINKGLQNQFIGDFAYDLHGNEYAVELKGRANYPTLRYPHLFPKINASMCTGKKETHCRWCCNGDCNPDGITDSGGKEVCFTKVRCPYRVQKAKALGAELAVVNIALFLNEANFVGGLSGWPWLVIDEADQLESALMSHIELEITKRWIDRLGLSPPARKTVEEAWIEWARNEAKPKVDEELERLQNQYGVEDMRRQQELERMQSKLNFFLREVAATKWVFLPGDERWVFKPVSVSRYAEQHLWRHANRFILMSATIISPDEMAHSLGIPRDEIDFIDLPSTFPPERRPIYYLPGANITKKTEANERPKAIAALDEILDKHLNDKALVHTVSYGYAQQVYHMSRHRKRMITYDCAQDRESKLEEFKNAPPGAVLVASSMERGIDLPGDQCQVVVIMKTPFLNLGDKQISTRLHSDKKGGQLWYNVNAIRTLVQMCGRGMRSAEDFCSIFILDIQFERLYRENKFLFPQWWRDALKMPKP